jgi:hypothetical protein
MSWTHCSDCGIPYAVNESGLDASGLCYVCVCAWETYAADQIAWILTFQTATVEDSTVGRRHGPVALDSLALCGRQ